MHNSLQSRVDTYFQTGAWSKLNYSTLANIYCLSHDGLSITPPSLTYIASWRSILNCLQSMTSCTKKSTGCTACSTCGGNPGVSQGLGWTKGWVGRILKHPFVSLPVSLQWDMLFPCSKHTAMSYQTVALPQMRTTHLSVLSQASLRTLKGWAQIPAIQHSRRRWWDVGSDLFYDGRSVFFVTDQTMWIPYPVLMAFCSGQVHHLELLRPTLSIALCTQDSSRLPSESHSIHPALTAHSCAG